MKNKCIIFPVFPPNFSKDPVRSSRLWGQERCQFYLCGNHETYHWTSHFSRNSCKYIFLSIYIDLDSWFLLLQTLPCPDCDLKFPMKAVLKFHQDSVHQVRCKMKVCNIFIILTFDRLMPWYVPSAGKLFGTCENTNLSILARSLSNVIDAAIGVPEAER